MNLIIDLYAFYSLFTVVYNNNSTEASIEDFERFLLINYIYLELEIVKLCIRFRNLIICFEHVIEFCNHLLRRLIEI